MGVEEDALTTVLAEKPDIFNHNIETVRRLHKRMRGAKVEYERALWLLRRAKELAGYDVLTKSGIIVGLGETNDEVFETLHDLRSHDVDVVTIGQYLQPSPKHAPIDRWSTPTSSVRSANTARHSVLARSSRAPLVRSSYRADEQKYAARAATGAV